VRRTFCDRCEEPCVNTTVMINVDVHHHTNDGQVVAEDNYRPIELCNVCLEALREFMPGTLAIRHHSDAEPVSEMARTEERFPH
jgi:hypothetical protein